MALHGLVVTTMFVNMYYQQLPSDATLCFLVVFDIRIAPTMDLKVE